MTAAKSSAQLKEIGPMKIKPTLVGFSLVLIKTRNAPIPTKKISQIEYETGFWTQLCGNKMSLLRKSLQSLDQCEWSIQRLYDRVEMNRVSAEGAQNTGLKGLVYKVPGSKLEVWSSPAP